MINHLLYKLSPPVMGVTLHSNIFILAVTKIYNILQTGVFICVRILLALEAH